jgi:branched-chain amino acid transport system substrate-binding protein
LLDSKALTKTQSIILIGIILVAVVGGTAFYTLMSGKNQSSETIKIGVFADLDGINGEKLLQGVILAAEQLNAEGGILGKQIEIFGEDSSSGTGPDPTDVNSALIRLITYHKVDFIIGGATDDISFMCQDTVSEHKKILFSIMAVSDTNTQRVLDDYDKYKYYFMTNWNSSTIFYVVPKAMMSYREITGFNKIGYLAEDLGWTKGIRDGFDYTLPENGFDLVYKGVFPPGTIDFSSYFAAAEAAGVEILIGLMGGTGGIFFVKEYHDRQSPLVIVPGYIGAISVPEGWERTDGKCEYVCVIMTAIVAGYPLTSKTLPAYQAYIDRWGETPSDVAGRGYDILRFILPDAIERAGTIETEAVIEALEQTSIETSQARNFRFTESHGVMMTGDFSISSDDTISISFQWQNGEVVPIFPEFLREEAGAIYMYPPWPGPWD